MSRIVLFLLLFCVLNNVESFNVEVLTTNLFDNLQADPRLLVDYNVGDDSRNFIKQQVQNYLNLITRRSENQQQLTKRKRSLTERLIENFSGTSILNGIESFATIPSKFSEDVVLFEQNNGWFLAILDCPNIKEQANQLKIYQIIDDRFEFITEIPIKNGRKIRTYPLGNTTLIIVVEHGAINRNLNETSGLYQFVSNQLNQIQMFNLTNCSDIEFWQIHEDLYFGIVYLQKHHQYEVDMVIYKWLGGHFDLIQTIQTKSPRKIRPFQINNSYYLAIANFRDNNGKTKIYSEIFKYNHHNNQYELYQRILTNACNDIGFFTMQNNKNHDYFLIIANFYEQNTNGMIDYETDSIVYKFVGNYFIPFQSFYLNGLENWLPIQYQDNSIALIAQTRYDGLKIYQYDGWSFIEINVRKSQQIPKKSIKSLHYYPNYNQTLIITQKTDNSSLYKIEFLAKNPLKELHDNLLNWCKNNRNLIDQQRNDGILTKSQRGDITIDEDIDQIDKRIELITKSVVRIENNLQTTLQSTIDKQIDRKLIANQLIFNNDVFIDNLNTIEMNRRNIDGILTNSFNISENFEINNMFDTIFINDSLIIETINGKPVDSLIYNNETLRIDQLKIDKVTCKNRVEIVKINDIEINNQNLLLTNQNQYFKHPIHLNSCEINELNTDILNNLSITSIDKNIETVLSIENLTVDHLLIGGYINDVDIPTLDKFTLKLRGNQNISELYLFKNLSGIDLITNKINDKLINNLINIDNNSYQINNEIIFTKNLTVNQLEIIQSLNNIKVYNNRFDALFRNIDKKQTITGKKTFKNLEILNPIDLYGKINCDKCKITNPVIIINQDLQLFNNYTMNGLVTIDELLQINNMQSINNEYSLERIRDFGLKLTTNEINIKLNFTQQLIVDEIFLEKINHFNVNDFVINGGNDVQIIKELKIFNNNIYIDGFSEIYKINHIDLDEFDRNLLRQHGDQIIVGKHHMKHVIIGSMSSNNTKFGEIQWNEMVNLTTNQNINETLTIKENLTTETLTINQLIINGLINNYNFTKLINDTVRKSYNSTIRGYKSFNNLTIDTLNANDFNTIDIDGIFNETNGVVNIEKSVNFHQSISIENIDFSNEINDINWSDFNKINQNFEETLVINTKLNLSNLIILGDCFIENSKINNININDLLENTIKTNEKHYFEAATFDTLITEQPVIINGEIEHVDFDNIVLSDSHLEQILFDKIQFLNNNLTIINGSINLLNFVNNINLNEFCDFTMGQINNTKNLIINNGNAYFVKGPNIRNLNNFNINHLWENAWFNNRQTTINGLVKLRNVVFDNDVVVDGSIDDIDLKQLSQNYFSKSKDQIITGNYDLTNTINFKSNLTITKLNHNGRMNDRNLEKLINNILLDDYNQTFENIVYLEHCLFNHINGEFLLNNYNLHTDLMRYDQINIVTGLKIIQNLFVEHLKIDKNIKLDNIEIIDWLNRIVTKSGDFNINSFKRFTNIFTPKLKLLGYLNDLSIDEETILVSNNPQDIAGKKRFLSTNRFKSIKLKRFLNNIELEKFVQNQVLNNHNNNLKSVIDFDNNNITTTNMIANKNFQSLNLTQLIENVENYGIVNNLLDNYRNLLTIAYKIDKSLQNTAYFLYDYEIIQTLTNYKQSFRLIYTNDTERIAAIELKDDITQIVLYYWNEDMQQFSPKNMIHYNSTNMNYIDQVLMKRYLYIEENRNLCKYVELTDPLVLVEDWSKLTNQTISTTSFILPTTNESCTLLIYKFGRPEIYCEIDEDLILMQSFDEISGAYKSSSIIIEDHLVLFIINHATNNMESGVTIWNFDSIEHRFVLKQKFNDAIPTSLSVISVKKEIFLCIASGHLQNSMYSGKVIIKKYGEFTKKFENYQNIILNSPKQVEFSLLPTNELILYIVTDNPTQSLLIYRYEGINRFQQKFIGTTLTNIDYFYQFISSKQSHFIVTQNNDEITILKVILKGEN